MEHDIRKITGRPTGMLKTIRSQLRINKQSTWVAYRVGTKSGWYVFNRVLKSGKLGRRWYIGYSMTFSRAISKARKRYGVSIPTANWDTITVKHYNLTNILDYPILKQLTIN